ncbi:leukotoxin LktA family filamentous adhesin [Endozoicomonas sp.]|nr:leukotoxin LktA family filamentous adhesin [Endozoicomonas sp.]
MAGFKRDQLSISITRANLFRVAASGRMPVSTVLGTLLTTAPALAVTNDIQAVGAFTDVTTTGNVHEITSKKRSGSSAINVFDKFVVGTHHTANLQVPNDADTLVNIVRGSDAPSVHGVLNSYKNGTLGGDVVFASSAGFVVGSTGIVNVGKLSIKTPSDIDISDLTSGDNPVDGKITNLLKDSYSVSSSGTVLIQGKINTAKGLEVNANTIQIDSSGIVIAGGTHGATAVGSLSAVNIDDLTIPTELQVSGGFVTLKASSSANNAINVSGDLYADGGFTITAQDIAINNGSTLDARNTDDSARGNVSFVATESQAVGIGSATAKTTIDLSGDIHANDVNATALSKANSSFYEEPGAIMGMVTGGVFAGASFYLMDADAEATVNVNSTANIQAKGDVKLSAESHALTEASSITLGSALPASLAAVYATSDATSKAHVKSGATIQADGDLDVTAHNEAYISISAMDIVAADNNAVVLAAAVGESDVDATAKIDSGVTLDAANLSVAAENQNSYYVGANAWGLTNTKLGIAVAVGDFDTNATAELGSGIGTESDKTGNVFVVALDRTLNQRVHSAVTVGSNLFMRTLGSKVVGGLASMQNGVNSLTSRFLPGGQSVPTDSSGKVPFKGGLAFTLNLSDHDAYSYIGTNQAGQTDAPTIKATGNILVVSQTDLGSDNQTIAGGNSNGSLGGDQGGYRTSAEASVASPSNNTNGTNQTPSSDKSLALALNFAINDSDAIAEVGKYVQLDGVNLGVAAAQHMPIVSTYDKWATFGDVLGKLNGMAGLQNNILTSMANAGAGANKEAYGGSVDVVWNDMDTKAWIGDGAKVDMIGTGSWSVSRMVSGNSRISGLFGDTKYFNDITYNFSFDNPVEVRAYNLMETISLAGNMGALGLIPNGNGTSEKGKSVGGSITYVQQSGSAVAGIGAATVNAAGNVGIYSETHERHFLVTPSSGMGSGVGFNGVLGILNSEVLTHASLHKNAQLSADKLIIDAAHEFGNWAAAGAFNWSDQSAIGIAIAANISQGDTKAFIGDNASEYNKVKFQDGSNTNRSNPDPSLPTAPTPTKGIIANTVSVRGRASGTNGSLAVAGAVTTEPTSEPGVGAKFENWFNGLSSKVAGNYTGASGSSSSTSVGQSSSTGSNGSGGSGSSSAAVSQAQTGMAAAGSFTVSVNNMDAKAIIEGASISGHSNGSSYNDVDVDVQALEKVISASASGSAALSMLGALSPTNQSTIAGAISYQISFNDALAWVKDTTITYADDVNVQALHGGELTAVALGLAVTRPSASTSSSFSGALSVSGVQVYDGTSARIQGSSISSNNGSNNDLEVSAYNNTYIGAGGGTLYAGGKQGAGLAITFAEINDPSAIIGDANPDGNNVLSTAYNEDVYNGAATEALIDFSGSTRNTLGHFDTIDVSARSLNRIGMGAAGIGYTDMTEGQFGFQGSFAIGSIGADTNALIKGADISGAGTVNVNASGEKDGTLDGKLSGLGSSNANSSYDFSGAAAMDNTKVHTNDDGSGSTYSYSTEGKRIIAVAGVVQAGKNNLGISYAHADVKTETTARIADTHINQSDNTGADVNVNARDDSLLYSVAIGVGGSKGQFSGVGSVAVNRLNNKIRAEIGDWNGSDKGTINASDLSVVAQNDMDMINVAGSVAIAGSTGLAAGLAVALNLVGTDEHSTKARVSNTTLNVDDGLTVKAYSGTSNDHNLLVGNAIAISAALQGGLAFAGAISVNNVDQSIEAGIKDTGTNRGVDASSTSGGDIVVRGQDFTDSVATAWMGAGSGQGSAVGVATATNRVDSDVTAEVLGDNSTRGSTTLKAQNLLVEAERRNWLLTIDAGVAASKQVSFAPSIGTGVIDGNVTARIAQDAKVEAWNNVVVNAEANSTNLVGSGALGIGIDGGAGALAVSTAVEYGKTEAFIDDAAVVAKGLGTNYLASSGKLTSQSALPDLSTSGEGDSSAVSMGQLTTGFAAHHMNMGTESASGLMVTATAKQKQRAITVGGAGSKNVALTANISTTSVDSETNAYIKNSDINQGATVTDEADVLVRGSSHSFGLTVAAGGSVTVGGESGVAAVGGFATNRESKDTHAYIESSNVNADAVKIDAEASKIAQAVAAGLAVAAGSTSGIGGAASVVITEQNGNTTSRLRGGVVTANSLVVNAETRQEANVAAGSAGIGTTVGVGAGLAVNLVGGDTKATIGKKDGDNNDNITTTVNVNDVDVDASRLESVYSYTFGAGIGASSTGVAAMINTTEISGETRAGIYGKYHNSDWTTKVRGKDGASKATTVNVRSQDILNTDHAAAGLGVGASVGVGAVANVLLGRSQAYGEIIGSEIKATTLEVDADTLREVDLISVSGAGGQYSAAISIGLVLMGQGDSTTDDGTNAENEFGDSRTLANNALAEDYSSYNPHLDSSDTSNMGGGGTITTSSSSSSSTYTNAGSRLKLKGESVTAARISGGVIDAGTLHVSSDAQLHTYQGIGAAQGSAVGVAGGIGVTRLYDMGIATVDADVTADTIAIGSLVRNKSNSEAAGEMKNFVIGAGGTAIGVSYSDVRSKHRVVAGLSQAVSSDTVNDAGTLSVSAKDATEIRIGDTGSDVSSNPEDGTMNIQVGAGAIGVSIGIAEKNSDVDAWLGTYDDNGTTSISDDTLSIVDGFSSQTVDAMVVGKVRSTAFAGAGGLIGGAQGVVTDARDYSNADAVVSGRIGSGSGSLTVKALTVPETFSRAYGVTVAGGASLGGSFSYAKADTTANAMISNRTQLSDNGAVVVEAHTGKAGANYVSANAAAFSASGALLVGISGSEAVATNNSDTTAKVGDYVQLPTGDLTVKANNQSRQISDADGYFVGAVAAGLTFSTAQSQTSARVLFGKDPIGPGSRTGDIILLANSIDENQGFSTAGGGGVVSGSATVSNAWTKDSNDKEAASVEIADWSSGYTSVPVGAGKVEMQANHQTWFFAGANSINASVLGGSGARADVEVDLDTSVDLGSNVSFYADEIDVSATNNVDQLGDAWFNSFKHSVKAGSGGAINGSAALSDIDISRLGASVDIGSNAVLKIDPLADALDAKHSLMDYHIQFDASTSFNLNDAVVLEVGGALQGAGAESNINVDTVNTVNIGSGAKLVNPVGQIEMGAYSRGFAVADASSTIWAAAGVAGGVSKVDLNTENKVNIYDNVRMSSFQSTKILTGRSADYITENYLSAVARTNVYNWTAIPIPATKTADADITVNNEVYFGNNVNVSSVRDILLEANRGQTYAKGDGVERNPYLELFSSETKFGSSNANKGTSKVIFNGTSHLVAGSRYQQSVTIDASGNITLGTGTEAVAYDYGSFSSRASLQVYINQLKAEKTALENETGGVTTGEGASSEEGGGGGGSTVANSADSPARIIQIEEELAFLEPLLQTLPETTNDAIYIGGLYAAGGDVNLKADVIEVQSGTPRITAHGDPTITVTNNSGKSLILGDMYIPNFGGGSVLETGAVANNMPAGLTVVEGNGGSGSHINVQHKPSKTTGADVILQGDLSNLGGVVTVNVEKGNLIQTGSVAAKQMALSVPSGIYLLNNKWGSPTYGFDAKSLSGFTSQWKPATPDQLVMYYVNARYKSEMSSKGEESFNQWWYGNDYYGNSAHRDGDLRVYLNWGFNDGAECKGGSDCEIFQFDNGAGGGSRGNGNWGFEQIKNLQNNLVKTATYQQVKNAGYGDRGGYALQAQVVAVNAYRIDINGTIRAGNFNEWSVEVGNNFDSAIAQYAAARGLSSGSVIRLSPGQALSWQEANPNYGKGFDFRRYITKTVNPQLSLVNGNDAGISISYEVGSGKITLDDVNASGNGFVSLRGRLMSTGADGKILVDDGRGSIDVVNRSASELVINDLNAGSQSTGVIRITDLNYVNGSGRNFSEWYVHEPGQAIQKYVTSASATSYSAASGSAVGYLESGKQTYMYQPKKGQLYYFVQREEVERSINWKRTKENYIDGWFSTYQPLGEWYYDNDNPNSAEWNIAWDGFTTCGSVGSVSCNADGSVSTYLTHVMDDRYKSQTWLYPYTTSYSKYYGGDFTKIKWNIYVPYYIAMQSTTYVKADHPIKFQFIGADTGSIDVKSRTGVTITGNVNNSSGTTRIGIDRTLGNGGVLGDNGNIMMSDTGIINSDKTYLNAAGSIGSSAQAMSLITDHISAIAQGGIVNLDMTAASGDIAVEKIHASSNLIIDTDKGLTPWGSGIHLKGDAVTINSRFGGLGDVSSNKVMNLSSSGLVTLKATGDIALNQSTGNLTVNTIESEAGDIWITLGNGHLVNGIGQNRYTDEELAYQASVWDKLNLKDDDAGRGTVTAYENRVSGQYHNYWLIKQRLDDDSQSNFTISADYIDVFKARYKAHQDALNGSNLDMNAISVAEVTSALEAEYRAIDQWLTQEKTAGKLAADYNLGNIYNSNYRFTIADNSQLHKTLTEGARWSDSQLEISISAAALQPVTDGYISGRDANISGNNVQLDISSGRVGKDLSDRVFAISRSNPTLTDVQKSALLEAGPGDLTITDGGSAVSVRVKQQDPIKINASGEVSLSATQQIYVESDQGLILKKVVTTGDVRLAASGDIKSASGHSTTIAANNLNLSTRSGHIGTEADPIRLDIETALRSVAAPSDIWLNHVGGNLQLGSIGAGGLLNLTNNGHIKNWSANGDNVHVLADGAVITATSGSTRYNIGESGRALSMQLGNGELQLTGASAWVNTDSTSAVNLGTVDLSGHFGFNAATGVNLKDNLSATRMAMDVTGDLVAEQSLSISSAGSVSIIAGMLDLEKASVSGSSVYLEADAGAASLATVTGEKGTVSLLASGDMTLYGPVQAKQALVVNAQSLSMQDGSQLTTDDKATVTTVGDMALETIISKHDLRLAGNAITINKDITSDAAIDIDANSLMTLAANRAVQSTEAMAIDIESLTMSANSRLSSGQALTVDVDNGNAVLAHITGKSVSLNSAGDIDLNQAVTSGGLTSLTAVGSVNQSSGKAVQSADDITITAADFTMGAGAAIDGDAGLTIQTADHQNLALLDVEGITTLASNKGGIFFNEKALLNGTVSIAANNGEVQIAEKQRIDAGSTFTSVSNTFNMLAGSTLQTADGIRIETAGAMKLHNLISAKGVHLVSGGAFETNGVMSAGTSLSLTSTGDTVFADTVSAVNDINLNASGHFIFNGDITSEQGSIILKGQKSLFVNRRVTAGADIGIDLGETLSLSGGQWIKAGSDSTIKAGNIYMGRNALLDVTGNTSLRTTGNQTLAKVSVGGGLTAQSTDSSILFSDDVAVKDDVAIDARWSASLAAYKDLKAGGAVTISADSIRQSSASKIDAGGSLAISAKTVSMVSRSNIKSGSDIEINASRVALLNSVDGGGNVSIASDGTLTINDSVTVTGTLTVQSGSIMTLKSLLSAGDDISINSGSRAKVDGDISSAIGGFGFVGKSDLYLNGSVNVAGAVSLNTPRSITLGAGGTLVADSFAIGSEAKVGAYSFTMNQGSTINANGLVVINTSLDQIIGQLTSGSTGKAFVLSSDRGGVFGQDDLNISGGERHLQAQESTSSFISAATGIGDPLVVNLPWLYAETDTGDINLIVNPELEERLRTVTNGNVYMTTMESVSLDTVTSTPIVVQNDWVFADSEVVNSEDSSNTGSGYQAGDWRKWTGQYSL